MSGLLSGLRTGAKILLANADENAKLIKLVEQNSDILVHALAQGEGHFIQTMKNMKGAENLSDASKALLSGKTLLANAKAIANETNLAKEVDILVKAATDAGKNPDLAPLLSKYKDLGMDVDSDVFKRVQEISDKLAAKAKSAPESPTTAKGGAGAADDLDAGASTRHIDEAAALARQEKIDARTLEYYKRNGGAEITDYYSKHAERLIDAEHAALGSGKAMDAAERAARIKAKTYELYAKHGVDAWYKELGEIAAKNVDDEAKGIILPNPPLPRPKLSLVADDAAGATSTPRTTSTPQNAGSGNGNNAANGGGGNGAKPPGSGAAASSPTPPTPPRPPTGAAILNDPGGRSVPAYTNPLARGIMTTYEWSKNVPLIGWVYRRGIDTGRVFYHMPNYIGRGLSWKYAFNMSTRSMFSHFDTVKDTSLVKLLVDLDPLLANGNFVYKVSGKAAHNLTGTLDELGQTLKAYKSGACKITDVEAAIKRLSEQAEVIKSNLKSIHADPRAAENLVYTGTKTPQAAKITGGTSTARLATHRTKTELDSILSFSESLSKNFDATKIDDLINAHIEATNNLNKAKQTLVQYTTQHHSRGTGIFGGITQYSTSRDSGRIERFLTKAEKQELETSGILPKNFDMNYQPGEDIYAFNKGMSSGIKSNAQREVEHALGRVLSLDSKSPNYATDLKQALDRATTLMKTNLDEMLDKGDRNGVIETLKWLSTRYSATTKGISDRDFGITAELVEAIKNTRNPKLWDDEMVQILEHCRQQMRDHGANNFRGRWKEVWPATRNRRYHGDYLNEVKDKEFLNEHADALRWRYGTGLSFLPGRFAEKGWWYYSITRKALKPLETTWNYLGGKTWISSAGKTMWGYKKTTAVVAATAAIGTVIFLNSKAKAELNTELEKLNKIDDPRYQAISEAKQKQKDALDTAYAAAKTKLDECTANFNACDEKSKNTAGLSDAEKEKLAKEKADLKKLQDNAQKALDKIDADMQKQADDLRKLMEANEAVEIKNNNIVSLKEQIANEPDLDKERALKADLEKEKTALETAKKAEEQLLKAAQENAAKYMAEVRGAADVTAGAAPQTPAPGTPAAGQPKPPAAGAPPTTPATPAAPAGPVALTPEQKKAADEKKAADDAKKKKEAEAKAAADKKPAEPEKSVGESLSQIWKDLFHWGDGKEDTVVGRTFGNLSNVFMGAVTGGAAWVGTTFTSLQQTEGGRMALQAGGGIIAALLGGMFWTKLTASKAMMGIGNWPFLGPLVNIAGPILIFLAAGKLLGKWLGQGKGNHLMANPNNPGTGNIQLLSEQEKPVEDKKTTSIERLQAHEGSTPVVSLIGGTKEEKEVFAAIADPEHEDAIIAGQKRNGNFVDLKRCGTQASMASNNQFLPKDVVGRIAPATIKIDMDHHDNDEGIDHVNVLAKIGPDSSVPKFVYPELGAA